jgi:hypothetical protein
LDLEGNAMTIASSEDVGPPLPTSHLRIGRPSKVVADPHNLSFSGEMFLALALSPTIVS